MNKAVPWRIKGVAFDARTAAIEAARRSGMSLGDWLNTVIEEQAREDGVDEIDLDADDRLQAVTKRLSSLRDDGETRPRALREPRGRKPIDRHADVEPQVAPEPSIPQPAPRDAARNDFKAEHLLENAIAAFDRRAHRSSERTARALSEVAELLDAGHRERARDDSALSAIAERLTGIEARVARDGAPKSDPAIHDAIVRLEQRVTRDSAPKTDPAVSETLARLEQRIETLAKQAKRPAVQDAPGDRAAAADLMASVAMPAPAPRRPLAAAIAEVARRQQELDADPAPRDMRAASPVRAHGFVAPAVRGPTPAAAVAAPLQPNPLEARLAALVERLEKSATVQQPPAPVETAGLENHINTLADRIETMRNEIAARPAPVVTPRSGDGIADIRHELAAMTAAVAGLAPRSSVTALETAVRDLSARVADSRIDGAGESALAPVEALVRELLGVVRSADPSASIESLDRGIRAVATKLETFSGITVSDPEAAREVAEQTRAMRDSLAQLAEKQIPAERIERGLVDLSARVDAIASAGVDPLGRGEMAQRVGEIRAMLSDPVAQERTLQTLEKRLEAIAARIDTLFGERFDTLQRSVAAQIDARPDRPDVEGLVADLGARLDNALSSGLKAMERTVARLVETNNAPRPEAPATRLEEMVRDLAARIDAGAAPNTNADALEGVQQQIARLAAHFDDSDRTSETLVALQKSVSDLFVRIDQSQQIAVEAAEAAARAAAAADHARDGADTDPELLREVADLRLLQNTADHRTHATLAAVHETLSRVVERLSNLEDDVADTRGEPVSAAYEPIPFRTPRGAAADREIADDGATRETDDIFIEPGTGFDRRPAGARPGDDRAELRPQASFIQAARRAAQAAQTSGDAMPLDKAASKRQPAQDEEKTGNAPLDTVRAYYASRKRPILLSLAALMVIFGAWQVAKVAIEDRAPAATSSVAPAPPREKAAEKLSEKLPEKLAPARADVATATDAAAPSVATPQARSAAVSPMLEPTPSATMAPASPAIDRSPVGTIGITPPPAVDTNGIVRALAVTGDPAAQFELAVRYADGKVLARDLKLSKEWFEKAAAKGVVPAQYRLGALFERGIGVPKDPAQAKVWYQRAADAGNARAMHNLAVLSADATDGKANYADAIGWFRRAAEHGVKDSQFNLAILYARGLGTPANMAEAYQWFAAAAAQGDEDAAKKRDDVGGRLQANDLARAKALFAAFRPKPLDAAANEVSPPAGGWESMKVTPRSDAKSTMRPKVSAL